MWQQTARPRAWQVATATHATVQSEVEWAAPASEIQKELDAMAEVQKRAVAALEKGEDAEGDLDQLITMVGDKQMPHYAARVLELADTDVGVLDRLARLPMVVHDLLPKFERVYLATGEGIVRHEAGYREFNDLERRADLGSPPSHLVGDALAEAKALGIQGKPRQPTQSILGVLQLAVRARPIFESLMRGVARDTAAGGEAEGVQWSPEGVQWEQAPLKKVGRCVEKLCLDPKQREALKRTPHDAEALNAEGILDMARAPRCDGDEALRGALTGSSIAGARDVHGQLDGARVCRAA